LWVYLVPSGKFRDSSTASFHVLSNSSFTCHPFIRRFLRLSYWESVVKWTTKCISFQFCLLCPNSLSAAVLILEVKALTARPRLHYSPQVDALSYFKSGLSEQV